MISAKNLMQRWQKTLFNQHPNPFNPIYTYFFIKNSMLRKNFWQYCHFFFLR